MSTPTLGQFTSFADDAWLHGLGCDWMDDTEAHLFAGSAEELFQHLADKLGTERYIDPSARISPYANIGERAIIGPGAVVNEFSTVRERTVLSCGVHVGYGCEVSRSVLLERAVLAHRVTLAIAVAGRYTHLAAGVMAFNMRLWQPDPLHPSAPVRIRLLDGTVAETGRAKIGAVFGDGVRSAANVTAGPGTLIGAHTVLYPGVQLGSEEVPACSVVRPQQGATALSIEPRRDPIPVTSERRTA
ncbi:transferase [Kitasatospora sp. NBC_01287]|uniref:transferase n=1 Tax=Kitasatospora sp. NBC_01287 TaxID=2903573 RepID=UPI00224EB5A1|nr:transferase [Kitasatospora sp. NBC_01287]MCX4745978.1 transferase [Kitasatospora sp. NBC_01287]